MGGGTESWAQEDVRHQHVCPTDAARVWGRQRGVASRVLGAAPVLTHGVGWVTSPQPTLTGLPWGHHKPRANQHQTRSSRPPRWVGHGALLGTGVHPRRSEKPVGERDAWPVGTAAVRAPVRGVGSAPGAPDGCKPGPPQKQHRWQRPEAQPGRGHPKCLRQRDSVQGRGHTVREEPRSHTADGEVTQRQRQGAAPRLEQGGPPSTGSCQTRAGTMEESRPQTGSAHDGRAGRAENYLHSPPAPCRPLARASAGRRGAGKVRRTSRVASWAAGPAWPRGALAWAQGAGPEPGLPT